MARKRRYHWRRETDLAEQVVAWLLATGWTVYEEVAGIDIVAERDGLRWAIECKRSWNLKVLAQAAANRSACHRSSIAVPASFLDAEERFGLQVAKRFGIGVLQVKRPDAGGRSTVHERLAGERRTATDGSIDRWLVERARHHARAGSAAASSWTPFKETCARLDELLARTPADGLPLTEALRRIDHHYASIAIASNSLRRAITESPELGFALRKTSGRWHVSRVDGGRPG